MPCSNTPDSRRPTAGSDRAIGIAMTGHGAIACARRGVVG
jgi:hypothetical protein